MRPLALVPTLVILIAASGCAHPRPAPAPPGPVPAFAPLPIGGATITGTVTGAGDGDDVIVVAIPAGGDPGLARAPIGYAEADGRFTLRGLGPGPHDLLATAPGRTTAAPVRVRTGAGAAPVRLALIAAPVTLALDVATTDGGRPAALRALAWDPAGVPHLGVRDGDRLVVPTRAGPHRLRVDARGYRPVDLALAAGATAAAVTLAPRRRVLLVSGADDFHDWRATSAVMRDVLDATGRYEVRLAEDVAILGAPEALAGYDAIVLNAQVAHASPAVRDGLSRYLEAGGGLVALHWVIASFPDWPGFAALLGRAWAEGRSGEDGDHPSRITPVAGHPITAGLAPFATGDDDMLHYDLVGDAPIEVLATATNASGTRTFPAMWATRPGRGRVVFASFGHSAAARLVPGVREAWLRAVDWTAGELAPATP